MTLHQKLASSQEVVITNTPVQEFTLAGRQVWVKREDLCSPKPGPEFSKIRGVLSHMKKREELLIGVLDTAHSKAGWAVAYCAKALNKKCLGFFPLYKGQEDLPYQQSVMLDMGADLQSLTAGRSAILYHRAKKLLPAGAYMMPNALKLPETVEETANEVLRTLGDWDHWVISASSGTISAGVIRGLILSKRFPQVWVHLGYSRTLTAVKSYLSKASGQDLSKLNLHIIDEKYAYKDRVNTRVPFPCNPFYDAKTWKWLGNNTGKLPGKILFWNIGA